MNTFNKEPEPLTSKGERTRAKILESALELFRRRGFEATTMRQVADAADVSVGNAYYYFASKEHLAHGLHVRTEAAFEERCRAVLAREARFERRLSGVLGARVQLAEPFHRFAPILFEPATERPSPFHPSSAESRALRASTLRAMTRVVEDSRARVHAELRSELPILLGLFQDSVLRFWARDDSPDQRRTARVIDHGSALLTRLVTIAGLPLMGPLRHATSRLVDDLREPVADLPEPPLP